MNANTLRFRPNADELADARLAAEELAERLGLEEQLAPFAQLRWDGQRRSGPTLFLEDLSGIPFLDDIVGVEEYQHRSRIRAGDGDLFAAVTPSMPGYGHYCAEQLQLGSSRAIR